MKKSTYWMFVAILLCGTCVFTGCTSEDNPTPKPTEVVQRQLFVDYLNGTLKHLASDMNFSGWEICNQHAKYVCKYTLSNETFKESVIQVMIGKMASSIKPVEEGSELAKLGYTLSGEIDFVNYDKKFTMTDEKTVTVTDAEGLEFETYGYNPRTCQMEQGLYMFKAKATGEAFHAIAKNLSEKAKMAIIVKFPAKMDIEFYSKTTGEWKKVLATTITTIVKKNEESAYFNPEFDYFSFTGSVESFIDYQTPTTDRVVENSKFDFALGQDNQDHEGNIVLSFVQNGKNLMSASMVFGKEAMIDWGQLKKSESIVELCIKLMENIALKDMTLSFLDDLTVQAAISDCDEMVRLNSEMIYARNHGADEATIESFTSQMNQLMTATMSVKSLDMLLPLKLKTALMGVDYNSVSAVKFNDENAFVPIVDLLDQQALRYWTNIKEHSAAPLQESMEILMQMIYIMNIFTGDVFDLDNYGNMDSVSQ